MNPTQTRWSFSLAWEGQRWLESLAQLPLEDAPWILGYLGETGEMRQYLAHQARNQLKIRGLHPRIRLRSSFRTGYCWIHEEVWPQLRRHQANLLEVTYPVLPGEASDRFLQELYPLSAELTQEGLEFRAIPGDPTPQYRVQAWRGPHLLFSATCPLPLVPSGDTWISSGALYTPQQQYHLPSDAQAFWHWYQTEVLPRALQQPSWNQWVVSGHLSESDGMIEALGEEVYFATLEALAHQQQQDPTGRTAQSGQIVPLLQARPGQPSQVQVTLTSRQPLHRPPAPRPAFPQGPWGVAEVMGQFEQLPLQPQQVGQSVQGRPLWVLRGGTGGPGLLITGGQHGNEATGVAAALELGRQLHSWPLDLAVIPLENPDGARLHRALAQLNPHHMHHPARYTALGDDLEYRLRQGDTRHEAEARAWAVQQVRPLLHLNLHGYPAQLWLRPFSGGVPRGFAAWTLPMGLLLILRYQPSWQEAAHQLAQFLVENLGPHSELAARTRQQIAARQAHSHQAPYQLLNGWPFIFQEVPERPHQAPLTLITEVPDETVWGQEFVFWQLAHQRVGEAATRWLLAHPPT